MGDDVASDACDCVVNSLAKLEAIKRVLPKGYSPEDEWEEAGRAQQVWAILWGGSEGDGT